MHFTSIISARSLLSLTLMLATLSVIIASDHESNSFEQCSSQSPCPNPNQPPIAAMSTTERTFIAIKPDGVQRRLVGRIIDRFEQRGYKLIAMKFCTPTEEHLKIHYEDLASKAFFPALIKYMLSGPICAMVWEGLDAVKQGRIMLGATNPLASNPGTIRGDFGLQMGRNICHGSDAVESANREIAHWFKHDELAKWTDVQNSLIYE
jgi:nucleoside-diphosphate kinase